jgi:hypothetical protein
LRVADRPNDARNRLSGLDKLNMRATADEDEHFWFAVALTFSARCCATIAEQTLDGANSATMVWGRGRPNDPLLPAPQWYSLRAPVSTLRQLPGSEELLRGAHRQITR